MSSRRKQEQKALEAAERSALRSGLVSQVLDFRTPLTRVAAESGVDLATLSNWVHDASNHRAAEILPEAIEVVLSDPERLQSLFVLLKSEESLPFRAINMRLGKLLMTCQMSAELWHSLFAALPLDGEMDFHFVGLIFRDDVPIPLLLSLVRQGRMLDAIGHRTEPKEVLEAVLEHGESEEAVCTLVERYYGKSEFPLSDLLQFVQKYSSGFLEEYLRNAQKHSELHPDMDLGKLEKVLGQLGQTKYTST